jgi:hypothetical protein
MKKNKAVVLARLFKKPGFFAANIFSSNKCQLNSVLPKTLIINGNG